EWSPELAAQPERAATQQQEFAALAEQRAWRQPVHSAEAAEEVSQPALSARQSLAQPALAAQPQSLAQLVSVAWRERRVARPEQPPPAAPSPEPHGRPPPTRWPQPLPPRQPRCAQPSPAYSLPIFPAPVA